MKSKIFKIPADNISEFIPGIGGCICSDKVTVEGLSVGYMSCDQPDFKGDSGWRIFSGTEDQDYVDNPDNSAIYDLNTITNYDKAIIKYLDLPVGSELDRISETNEFKLVE